MPLPPGVTPKHGRYYVVRQNKWHPLTRVEEGEVACLEAYYELTKASPHNMAGVLLAFVKNGMGALRPPTQRDYRRIVITRLIPFCGHMARNSVKPSHVAQYLDRRQEEGSPVAGNRERACLSSACNYGMRKGWLESNPCRGVRRNRERPSRAYVETDALIEMHGRAHAALQLLVNGAYLSGIRFTDLAALKRSMLVTLKVDGQWRTYIRWDESKTDKPNLMEVGPLLAEVFRRAIEYGDAISTKITKKLPEARPLPEHIFVNTRGQPWTQYALSSAMRYAKAPFAFRQLRAKAETDASNKNVLGHEGQMKEVYTRLRRLKSVG
jgi:integrase